MAIRMLLSEIDGPDAGPCAHIDCLLDFASIDWRAIQFVVKGQQPDLMLQVQASLFRRIIWDRISFVL